MVDGAHRERLALLRLPAPRRTGPARRGESRARARAGPACSARSRSRLYSELVASRVARRMIQRLAHAPQPALLVAVADVRHVGRVEPADDHHRRLAQEPRERDREERVPGGEPAEHDVGAQHAADHLHAGSARGRAGRGPRPRSARRGCRGRSRRSSPCGCARRGPASGSRRHGLPRLDERRVPLGQLEQAVEDRLVVGAPAAVLVHQPAPRRPGRSARRAASPARSGARPPPRARRAASRRTGWRSRASSGSRPRGGQQPLHRQLVEPLRPAAAAPARVAGMRSTKRISSRSRNGTRSSSPAAIDILSLHSRIPSGRNMCVSR